MEEYQDQSLRGKVFHKLRENILSGVYQDHEELREAAIGEEMGVSPHAGAGGLTSAGTGRTGDPGSKPGSLCDRDQQQGRAGYL